MKKRCCFAVLLLLCVFTVSIGNASSTLFPGMLTYDEGQYWVGMDFVAGEYVLLSTSDYSGYFAITSDSNGNNIISNGLFAVNSIITVKSGEYLELSRCIAIKASDFYSQYTIKYENDGVMLKVGYDIEPGTYKVVAASGTSGYYCIYNDSRQTAIVSNDLFRNSAWVTVRSGQYLVLTRCHIDQ